MYLTCLMPNCHLEEEAGTTIPAGIGRIHYLLLQLLILMMMMTSDDTVSAIDAGDTPDKKCKQSVSLDQLVRSIHF
eukprot:scaffold357956_cov59-Attheya_sp.AAC.2